MAQQTINIGVNPNDGLGDPLRTAFDKCNQNFTELYSAPGGSGTVTSVGVANANGISGTVSNPTTTPSISLSLGNITPASVNGITFSGTSTPSLSITGSAAISGSSSGTNTGDQTIQLTTDVVGSGTGTIIATIAPGAVNTSKLGGDITTAGKALLDDANASAQRTTLGLGSLATLSTVPYSSVDNVISNRILARSTSGTGAAEILTTSNVLDFITSTQGALLYRASGTWFGIAPSTSGYVLTTNGANANPSWSQVNLTSGVTGDLPLANIAQASGASILLGRGSAAGAGDFQEITLGSNLSMSGTTLNATTSAKYRADFTFVDYSAYTLGITLASNGDPFSDATDYTVFCTEFVPTNFSHGFWVVSCNGNTAGTVGFALEYTTANPPTSGWTSVTGSTLDVNNTTSAFKRVSSTVTIGGSPTLVFWRAIWKNTTSGDAALSFKNWTLSLWN